MTLLAAQAKLIMLPRFFCKKCKKRWHPRINRIPKFCPRCKNKEWDKPYERTNSRRAA